MNHETENRKSKKCLTNIQTVKVLKTALILMSVLLLSNKAFLVFILLQAAFVCLSWHKSNIQAKSIFLRAFRGSVIRHDSGPLQNSPHKVLLTDHIYPILKEVVSCRMTRLTSIGHRASPNGLMSMEINRSHPNWMPMGDFGLMFQTTLSLYHHHFTRIVLMSTVKKGWRINANAN